MEACKAHGPVHHLHTEEEQQQQIDAGLERHRRGVEPHDEEEGLAHILQCMLS